MAQNSNIEWTDHTFNPWIGCSKLSPACAHCYAERQDGFRRWTPEGWGPGKPRRHTSTALWAAPLKWEREAAVAGRRDRVFCASLADVFDQEVDPAWRAELWALIRNCSHLDWQILTKRPEHIASCLPSDWGAGWPNVWMGTSAEDQKWADIRIPHLLAVPAAIHFLSVEPLLGPICFPTLDGISWVIVGGESGPGARPMEESWVLDIRDQCHAAAVPFFFKQWGGVIKQATGRLLQGQLYDEFPQLQSNLNK